MNLRDLSLGEISTEVSGTEFLELINGKQGEYPGTRDYNGTQIYIEEERSFIAAVWFDGSKFSPQNAKIKIRPMFRS